MVTGLYVCPNRTCRHHRESFVHALPAGIALGQWVACPVCAHATILRRLVTFPPAPAVEPRSANFSVSFVSTGTKA